jgi:hypothetical protein
LLVRPQFRLTLLHPSGDSSRNFTVNSATTPSGLDFAHAPHVIPPTTNDAQRSFYQQQPQSNPDEMYSCIGVSRFLSHSAVLSQFVDHAGCILLRVEMLDLRHYNWSVSLAQAVPLIEMPLTPPLVAAASSPYPSLYTHSHHLASTSVASVAAVASASATAATTERTLLVRPQLVQSLTEAAKALLFSSAALAQREAAAAAAHNSRIQAPLSSSFGLLSSSSASRLQQSVSRVVGAQMLLPHSWSMVQSAQGVPSSLLQPLVGSLSAHEQASRELNLALSSSALGWLSSFVSSSHVMFDGYEFRLHLLSRHLHAHRINCARLDDVSLVLELHPRHLYRFREDMSLAIEAELTVFPAFARAPAAAAREAGSDCALRFNFRHGFHAQAPYCEWRNVGAQLLERVKAHEARGGFQFTNEYYAATSSSASADTVPTRLSLGHSLSSFASLHTSLSFKSQSVVWRLPNALAHEQAKRRHSMPLRLKDLTWNSQQNSFKHKSIELKTHLVVVRWR